VYVHFSFKPSDVCATALGFITSSSSALKPAQLVLSEQLFANHVLSLPGPLPIGAPKASAYTTDHPLVGAGGPLGAALTDQT
jgi:hypothetical protein